MFGNPALSAYLDVQNLTIYYNSTWNTNQFGWNMPITSFNYGYLNTTDPNNNTVYYQPLTSNTTTGFNNTILFSLDFPGIGLPLAMYQIFANMTQNITSFNMNCTGYNNTWPLNQNCFSTTNQYNSSILDGLQF